MAATPAADAQLDNYERVAVLAAKDAGAVIDAAFRKEKNIEHKGAMDLVTETDKECEALILQALQDAFPTHRFIGEEGSAAQGFTSELTDEPTWLVDPLDGTTNFVHRFPFVCVSIALAINKKVVVGVVYNPVMRELFTAVAGRGARLNGAPICVSRAAELGAALLVTEVGVARDDETIGAIFGRMGALTKQMRAVRALGSCALDLCSVACGRADAMFEVGFGGPWDCAAGALVVLEAGGRVTDVAGGPFGLMARRVLATNVHLADAVAAVLREQPLGPREPQPPA
ncbi:hypothetical protein WJX81_001652 [Elliptochloris bilobata]|uniref:Inositol-1-monophosphatase n=1 Tax=Elliptochloris bilobata TaxID=381761 RepID=A0AAW1S9Y9_9CHLO